MASARHIKMTHSCSWPVVYISASISFLYVRKKAALVLPGNIIPEPKSIVMGLGSAIILLACTNFNENKDS